MPTIQLYSWSPDGMKIDTGCGAFVELTELERILSQCDALQQLLNARDEEVSRLRSAGKEMLRIVAIANQGSAAYNRAIINLHQTLENQA